MDTSTRGRLVAFIALATLCSGAAFAVTDGNAVSSRSVAPQGEVHPPLRQGRESGDAARGVLGAQARSATGNGRGTAKSEDAKRRADGDTRRDDDAEGGEEAALVAALIPAGTGGGGLPLPCGDT